MALKSGASYCLLVGTLVASDAFADDYDYEIGVAFERASFDGSRLITTAGGSILNRGSTRTDSTSVLGSWYFSGLSDDKGPRARAVLIDRASSLSVGFGRADLRTTTFLSSSDPAFPFGTIDSSLSSTVDWYAADFRYVDKDSGWFGSAGALRSNTSFGNSARDSFDATGWSLSAGKYLFENTTLSVDFGQVDVGGGNGDDSTVVGVTAEHLGDLGQGWKYAIDLSYSHLDPDVGSGVDTWRGALSFYPNRDVEFGLGVEDISGRFIGQGSTGVEGFASWFVKPNIRLSARYRRDDADYIGNVFLGSGTTVDNSDSDSVEFSATVRF